MTTKENVEIIKFLTMLVNTDAGIEFMLEAFYKDNPSNYFRSCFVRANTLFGALIIKINDE